MIAARYKLPVVIITKTFYDEDPVDANKLVKKLKGVAHVLVQGTNCTNIYASTPSDKGHGGKNNARTTMKKAF